MVKRKFTEKEKIVFYGIIKYPGINDNALSKIIDINASTIATIRNKLKKKNYFHMIRIPFLQHCGFELLSTSYDRIYSPTISESPNYILGNIYKKVPNIFLLLSAPDAWLAFGFYQNYLNFKRTNELIRFNKYQFNIQEDTEKQILFPFGLTKIYNFFDYSKIIRNFFEIDPVTSNITKDSKLGDDQIISTIKKSTISNTYPSVASEGSSSKRHNISLEEIKIQNCALNEPSRIKLTKAEREVFLALVQYPELSDFAINKVISISATSINNIRKKFESQSIIKQVVVPNLSLLGFELMTLTHLRFRSYGNLDTREELINILLDKIPNILFIANNTDEIILSVYKNFSEYQHINDEISKIYRDNNLLASEPRTLLFPLSESKLIKDHIYVPLVNQFLGRGKSVIDSILNIIGKKIGETGKQILIQHLESINLMIDELTTNDIPKLIKIIQEIMTPIFGEKSASEIANEIKKLSK